MDASSISFHISLISTIASGLSTLFCAILFTKWCRKQDKFLKENEYQIKELLKDLSNIEYDIKQLKSDLSRIDKDIYDTQRELVKLMPPKFDELHRQRKQQRDSGNLEVIMPLHQPSTSCTMKGTCSEVQEPWPSQ